MGPAKVAAALGALGTIHVLAAPTTALRTRQRLLQALRRRGGAARVGVNVLGQARYTRGLGKATAAIVKTFNSDGFLHVGLIGKWEWLQVVVLLLRRRCSSNRWKELLQVLDDIVTTW
uniref:Uncharacterized protein n=1 Tax=Hyaloperonospora arabidopsidis (strain Emoy2) TaxID=559515 RepID=M4B2M1_HYAAE